MRFCIPAALAALITYAPAALACTNDGSVVCAAALTEVEERPAFQVGDTLPFGHNILFNPEYYGLPPVSGYWRYYRVDGEVFRVHAATMEILERVTEQSAMLR